jgi:hypothetical protein
MKKLFLLMLAFMFALLIVSCGDDNNDPVDNETTTDDAVTVDDNTVVTDETVTEEEPDDDTATVTCKLEDTFFDAMSADWTAYFTMKMSGLINDPDNADPDFAFLTKIGATLLGETYNLGDNYGMYMLDSVTTTDGTTLPAIVAVGVGNLTWPVTNKLAALWAGQTFVVVDDLLAWKEQAELEGMTGVSVDGTYQVAVFEVWIEVTTAAQYTRMECIRGLSAMNEAGDAFDGAMFVCTDTNTEWAIDEQMKMMNYSKMIDDPTELLAAMNEGLETSDPNYRTDVCRCWEQDGTTVIDCEDFKDEFGVGELPDEESDDLVTDDVVTDETVTDDDVLLTD